MPELKKCRACGAEIQSNARFGHCPQCEQSWALTVIESVLAQLRMEYSTAGKGHIFEAIHAYLAGDGAQTYAEIAARLNMTEGAVKMAVLRLRESFRHLLRSNIAQTVADASEIDPNGEL